jgi:glutaminyl-peptide cyclotransferase
LKTQQYIISKLKSFDFQVTLDTFETDTIIGKKTFTNIIASHKNTSHLKENIVLAAHYESKIFNEFEFLGAIDSVVSCSMLLEFSRFIDYHIEKFQKTSIQLIFFDGEEAFKEWTETDSIYGATHLASKWKSENKLKDISLFVLLDLIGTKETDFQNHQIHHATGTNQLVNKWSF